MSALPNAVKEFVKKKNFNRENLYGLQSDFAHQ